jgi:hypothetical protein
VVDAVVIGAGHNGLVAAAPRRAKRAVRSLQIGGLHVQGHPPPVGVVGDGGEQNLGPILGEHAP